VVGLFQTKAQGYKVACSFGEKTFKAQEEQETQASSTAKEKEAPVTSRLGSA